MDAYNLSKLKTVKNVTKHSVISHILTEIPVLTAVGFSNLKNYYSFSNFLVFSVYLCVMDLFLK